METIKITERAISQRARRFGFYLRKRTARETLANSHNYRLFPHTYGLYQEGKRTGIRVLETSSLAEVSEFLARGKRLSVAEIKEQSALGIEQLKQSIENHRRMGKAFKAALAANPAMDLMRWLDEYKGAAPAATD